MEEIKQGYKQTDIGVIPEDWGVEPIGNLFVFKNGLNKAKEFFGYGTPIVNYMDVYSKNSLISSDIKGKVYLSNSEIQRYDVKAGDVFFTRTSETPEEVGISSVVLDCSKNTVFSGFVLRGRPINNKLSNEFKSYCFQTRNVRSSIIQGCTYTTRALTNGTQLSKILIPIPTLKEQTAIATALSDTDALIAALDKKIAKKQQIKQGAMQQLLTGKKRLPGFSGEWVEKKLGELLDYEQPTDYIVKSTDYLTQGIPVLTAGKSFILGYTAETTGIFTNSPVIIFDDFTTATKFVDFKFKVKSSAMKILKLRESNNSIKLIYELMQLIDFPLIDHQRYWISEYSKIIVKIPATSEEQTAIAQILTDMDNEIAQLQRERDKYKEIKAGMMQVLLTGRVRLV